MRVATDEGTRRGRDWGKSGCHERMALEEERSPNLGGKWRLGCSVENTAGRRFWKPNPGGSFCCGRSDGFFVLMIADQGDGPRATNPGFDLYWPHHHLAPSTGTRIDV